VFFPQKYIKIIYFFIFKKLFLTSAYRNDLKTPKKILIESKEKNKKFSNFFKSVFETQKQTGNITGFLINLSG
jgi:hypothetical protein